MADKRKHRFSVHPSVVYQLGESLVSDAVQALVELVKNCYDADASYAKVIIDTEGVVPVEGCKFSSQGGRIVVEDDGFGMDMVDIESGWLTISSRRKKEQKKAKRTTEKGRFPLGDKGLGRLGVQKLGEELEIFTKSKREGIEQGYHFGFSWLDFQTAPSLGDVEIILEDFKGSKKTGTKVVVSKLKEPEIWKGRDAISKLEKELSKMLSPYKQIRDFIVFVEIDGKSIELLEVSDKVRDIAPIRYSFNFDGKILAIKGKAKLDFFRPSNKTKAEEFALMVEADGGDTFFGFLGDQKTSKSIKLSRSDKEKWFVEFEQKTALIDLVNFEWTDSDKTSIANPGPFYGEVDSFDLSTETFHQQAVFDRQADFRKHVKDLSGIGVYRDGFSIRVAKDWLKLGTQWTSAKSYYGLKPDNTLGYIALTARDNLELEETTDREGFLDTPYYRNFELLLQEFVRFTAKVHNLFGRSLTEFRKKRNEEIARIDARKTVEDISHTIKAGLAEAPSHQKKLNALRTKLNKSSETSKAISKKFSSAKELTNEIRENVNDALSSLEKVLEEAEMFVGQVSDYLEEIGKMEGMGQVLEDRVEGLRNQLDDVYETVALGLTAEALSHEVFNISDQLARRTKSAQTSLRQKEITDRVVISFIEYVHSSIMALRKQISFLSPSLRYVREQRHVINLHDFLIELKDFYKNRLLKDKISFEINSAEESNLLIKINRGKLTQIIDNFILNSIYWLKEDIKQKRKDSGSIVFNIKPPFLQIYDNGSGISPNVEHAIFEPFISAKSDGRGLGLFIVKQLLDSEGCRVGVVPERNNRDRLFKFQIDFRGALNE